MSEPVIEASKSLIRYVQEPAPRSSSHTGIVCLDVETSPSWPRLIVPGITKSNWGKMDWLGRWHLPDVLNFFSEVNMPRYKLQRRHIGQIYSPVNLKKHEASIDGVLQRYIPKLKSFQGEEVELEQWAHIPVLG